MLMTLAQRPCFKALQRDFALPSGVLGPVDPLALERLAVIFRSESGLGSDGSPGSITSDTVAPRIVLFISRALRPIAVVCPRETIEVRASCALGKWSRCSKLL